MRIAFGLLLALLLTPVQAAETVFNYDGFYARLKKSEQAKYANITLAFYLQQSGSGQSCQAERALITTDISSEPLTIASNGELVLPYSELLNSRKALIRIVQPSGAVACDLNFRLRSRLPLDSSIEIKQLLVLRQQLNDLLRDLAGLGRYFLPDMTGVTVVFDAPAELISSSAEFKKRVSCTAERCHIDLQGLIATEDASATTELIDAAALSGDAGVLVFNKSPLHLVPFLATAH